ncbi:MAG TPA: PIN domain-containing protein [Thermodesulfovibrionia bacterium]|nr:PIN domain-containing protein [Thermodesulfovibrionia bacterium]
MKKVVVDSNVFFSILLGKSQSLRDILFSDKDIKFYSCRFSIIELFKHKEKLKKYSLLKEEEILDVFYSILKKVEFYNEDLITDRSLHEGFILCDNIDEKDVLFVSLTIELGALLWTGDKKLMEGLKSKGFYNFFTIEG